jgi:pimeloyl-ACP methyl ester carboxylesterase
MSMSKATSTATTAVEEREFHLPSGRIHAEVSGNADAPLVIGVPGLSANLRSFDAVWAALDPARHRRLAYDPRGRARSEVTPAGTYGWPAHARDIVAMADELGARQFDLVGWSMGSWIALKTVEMFPDRVRSLVLIDGGGSVEDSARTPVIMGLDRLSTVWPSREQFIGLVSQLPNYQPWNPAWERLFDYELEDVEGGVRARTQKEAPWEDEEYRLRQDPFALWKSVTMPSLMLRARREIMDGLGYILPEADAERYAREVPGARLVTIDANHYVIGFHEETARVIAGFLDEPLGA